jgi:hypothetical protein
MQKARSVEAARDCPRRAVQIPRRVRSSLVKISLTSLSEGAGYDLNCEKQHDEKCAPTEIPDDGALFFHCVLSFLQIDSNHEWTLMLDKMTKPESRINDESSIHSVHGSPVTDHLSLSTKAASGESAELDVVWVLLLA